MIAENPVLQEIMGTEEFALMKTRLSKRKVRPVGKYILGLFLYNQTFEPPEKIEGPTDFYSETTLWYLANIENLFLHDRMNHWGVHDHLEIVTNTLLQAYNLWTPFTRFASPETGYDLVEERAVEADIAGEVFDEEADNEELTPENLRRFAFLHLPLLELPLDSIVPEEYSRRAKVHYNRKGTKEMLREWQPLYAGFRTEHIAPRIKILTD